MLGAHTWGGRLWFPRKERELQSTLWRIRATNEEGQAHQDKIIKEQEGRQEK